MILTLCLKRIDHTYNNYIW